MAGQVPLSEATARLAAVGHALNLPPGGIWQFAPALGVAWRPPAGPGVRCFLYQELRARLVRRCPRLAHLPLVGAATVGGVTHRCLDAHDIEGPNPESRDCLLVLGRTRAKLLNYDRSTATAVEDHGHATIDHELAARDGCGDRTTTKLLEVIPGEGIFIERLEPGMNLAIYGTAARMTPQVADLLHRWRAGRTRDVGGSEHLVTLEARLGAAIRQPYWEQLRAQLPVDVRVSLELSHGDVQPANVLETNEGLRLVDFERLDWRVRGYDLATFSSALRWSTAGLADLQPWLAAEEFCARVRSDAIGSNARSMMDDSLDLTSGEPQTTTQLQ